MPCVVCSRRLDASMPDSEVFMCWYCRASRVASAAKIVRDLLEEEEHDPAELERAVDRLDIELSKFHYSGMDIKQLEKPIKGLEEEKMST